MVRLIVKMVVSAALLLATFTVVSHLLLSSSERQAEKRRVAFCEMVNIALAVEDELLENGYVPANLTESNNVSSLKGRTLCVGEMRMEGGEFLDPWGDPYCYEVLSSTEAVLRGPKGIEIHIPVESQGR
jgi:hypothetical protein